jgi:hypothetical protein
MKPILHLVNRKFKNKAHFLLGSVKDINSRVEYFNFRNFLVDRIELKVKFFDAYEILKYLNRSNYSFVLVEQSPSFFVQLLIFFKFGKVIYRSHNAEFYHRFHIFKYNLIHFSLNILFKNKRMSIYRFVNIFFTTFIILPINILRYFFVDILTSILARTIVSESEWSKNYYWKYFPFVKKYHANTFLSAPYLKKVNKLFDKKNVIIISGSYFPNSISYEQVRSIYILLALRENSKLFEEFQFIVTGKVSLGILDFLFKKGVNQIKNLFFYHDKDNLVLAKEIRNFKSNLSSYPWSAFNSLTSDDVGNYYDLLASAKAMMFCTSAGFGTKTKAVEAMMHKCFLVLNNELFERVPNELNKIMIKYDSNNFEDVLKTVKNYDFPKDDFNKILKESSFKNYDQVFGYMNEDL